MRENRVERIHRERRNREGEFPVLFYAARRVCREKKRRACCYEDRCKINKLKQNFRLSGQDRS